MNAAGFWNKKACVLSLQLRLVFGEEKKFWAKNSHGLSRAPPKSDWRIKKNKSEERTEELGKSREREREGKEE